MNRYAVLGQKVHSGYIVLNIHVEILSQFKLLVRKQKSSFIHAGGDQTVYWNMRELYHLVRVDHLSAERAAD